MEHINLLRELFFGNMVPNEYNFSGDPAHGEMTEEMLKYEERLSEALKGEEKGLFEKFSGASQALACEENALFFSVGFRLGARMMCDILLNDDWRHYIEQPAP